MGKDIRVVSMDAEAIAVIKKNLLVESNGWKIIVRDEGTGFSKAALQHATERLWRDDIARSRNNHNGIGLWFALQVVKMHSGQINLQNYDCGGMVTVEFQYTLTSEKN